MEEIKRYPLSWEFVAAVTCFAGAAISVVLGFILTTRWFLEMHPSVRGIGLTLLIVGIPILILGGHFLDLRDKRFHIDD